MEGSTDERWSGEWLPATRSQRPLTKGVSSRSRLKAKLPAESKELSSALKGFDIKKLWRFSSEVRVESVSPPSHFAVLEARLAALEYSAVASRVATPQERARWAAFQVEVSADGRLPKPQRSSILDTWNLLMERDPRVMYPTADTDAENGNFFFSWNLDDRSMEIQIAPDGTRTWFFTDHTTGVAASSDEGAREGFLTFASAFRRRGS